MQRNTCLQCIQARGAEAVRMNQVRVHMDKNDVLGKSQCSFVKGSYES